MPRRAMKPAPLRLDAERKCKGGADPARIHPTAYFCWPEKGGRLRGPRQEGPRGNLRGTAAREPPSLEVPRELGLGHGHRLRNARALGPRRVVDLSVPRQVRAGVVRPRRRALGSLVRGWAVIAGGVGAGRAGVGRVRDSALEPTLRAKVAHPPIE